MQTFDTIPANYNIMCIVNLLQVRGMWEVRDWGYDWFFAFPLNDVQNTENTKISASLTNLIWRIKLFWVSDVNYV